MPPPSRGSSATHDSSPPPKFGRSSAVTRDSACRVQLVVAGLKPYGWEIYDEEDGRTVRRSAARFRSSAEAWQAGTAVLAQTGAGARAGGSPRQVARRAVVGPGVGVAAGGGEAGVADGGLHEVDGGAAVERVADMGVAQPVRRDGFRQSGALGGLLDDAVHLRGIERAALPRAEHRRVGVFGPQARPAPARSTA